MVSAGGTRTDFVVLLRDSQSDPYHVDIPAYNTRRGPAQGCVSPPRATTEQNPMLSTSDSTWRTTKIDKIGKIEISDKLVSIRVMQTFVQEPCGQRGSPVRWKPWRPRKLRCHWVPLLCIRFQLTQQPTAPKRDIYSARRSQILIIIGDLG